MASRRVFQLVQRVAALTAIALLTVSVGCAEKKTRKMTIEGPEKKTEIKLETTKSSKDKND